MLPGQIKSYISNMNKFSDARIKKLQFSVDFERLTENFVGRKWVFDAIDHWLQETNNNPFIIVGDPGIGKTAIVAQLVRYRKDIVAYNFCSAGQSDSITPVRVLTSIAAQLIENLPGYAKALMATIDPVHLSININIDVEKMSGGQIIGLLIENLIAPTPLDYLQILLQTPLSVLPPQSRPLVIAIDALDEAVNYPSKHNLVKLLANLQNIPGWIRILATTRSDRRVMREFNNVELFLIEAKSKDNTSDISTYIDERVANSKNRTLLSKKSIDDLQTTILSNSNGNFLYCQLLLDGLDSEAQPMDPLVGLPAGLHEIYHQFLARFSYQEWVNLYQPILGTLSVALEPMSEDNLENFTGMPKTKMRQYLGVLKQFLEKHPDETYSIYHHSFRNYLLDRKVNEDFWCYDIDFTNKIIDYYLSNRLSDTYEWDIYGVNNIVKHLISIGNTESAVEIMVESRRFLDANTKLLANSKKYIEDAKSLLDENSFQTPRDIYNFVRLLAVNHVARIKSTQLNKWLLGAEILKGNDNEVISRVDLISIGQTKLECILFILNMKNAIPEQKKNDWMESLLAMIKNHPDEFFRRKYIFEILELDETTWYKNEQFTEQLLALIDDNIEEFNRKLFEALFRVAQTISQYNDCDFSRTIIVAFLELRLRRPPYIYPEEAEYCKILLLIENKQELTFDYLQEAGKNVEKVVHPHIISGFYLDLGILLLKIHPEISSFCFDRAFEWANATVYIETQIELMGKIAYSTKNVNLSQLAIERAIEIHEVLSASEPRNLSIKPIEHARTHSTYYLSEALIKLGDKDRAKYYVDLLPDIFQTKGQKLTKTSTLIAWCNLVFKDISLLERNQYIEKLLYTISLLNTKDQLQKLLWITYVEAITNLCSTYGVASFFIASLEKRRYSDDVKLIALSSLLFDMATIHNFKELASIEKIISEEYYDAIYDKKGLNLSLVKALFDQKNIKSAAELANSLAVNTSGLFKMMLLKSSLVSDHIDNKAIDSILDHLVSDSDIKGIGIEDVFQVMELFVKNNLDSLVPKLSDKFIYDENIFEYYKFLIGHAKTELIVSFAKQHVNIIEHFIETLVNDFDSPFEKFIHLSHEHSLYQLPENLLKTTKFISVDAFVGYKLLQAQHSDIDSSDFKDALELVDKITSQHSGEFANIYLMELFDKKNMHIEAETAYQEARKSIAKGYGFVYPSKALALLVRKLIDLGHFEKTAEVLDEFLKDKKFNPMFEDEERNDILTDAVKVFSSRKLFGLAERYLELIRGSASRQYGLFYYSMQLIKSGEFNKSMPAIDQIGYIPNERIKDRAYYHLAIEHAKENLQKAFEITSYIANLDIRLDAEFEIASVHQYVDWKRSLLVYDPERIENFIKLLCNTSNSLANNQYSFEKILLEVFRITEWDSRKWHIYRKQLNQVLKSPS